MFHIPFKIAVVRSWIEVVEEFYTTYNVTITLLESYVSVVCFPRKITASVMICKFSIMIDWGRFRPSFPTIVITE